MFTEDLDAFLNTGELAVEATYDTSTTVKGFFDSAFLEQLDIVAGKNPVFVCKASAVAADPTAKALVVNSVTYNIRGIEPIDDGAFVLLRLERSSV